MSAKACILHFLPNYHYRKSNGSDRKRIDFNGDFHGSATLLPVLVQGELVRERLPAMRTLKRGILHGDLGRCCRVNELNHAL